MPVMKDFFDKITEHLQLILEEEEGRIQAAATLLAEQIRQDKLVYIWGPGGHSNMSAMEVFFRAGSLMHMSAILDEGTMLSSGALRSMSIERTLGYGQIVIADNGIKKGDVVLIANSYGINTACIEAAHACRQLEAVTIAVTSVAHALSTPADHPARHPGKENLYDICDHYIDCKIVSGDAVMDIPGIPQKMGAMSTFANAFVLNCLLMETGLLLGQTSMEVPIWRSGNCPGGDEWNEQFIQRFRGRIRWL